MNISSKFIFLKNLNFLLIVFAALAAFGGLGEHLKGAKFFDGREYTHYNNYLIFKYAFFHLIENKDLYIAYPDIVWDLFKYSPTFALLMGPLAFLPDVPGLICWNLINALAIYFGIKYLPIKSDETKVFILWFVALELLISIQNSQSNGLIAGLIILAFCSFERRSVFLAAFCILLSFYVKLFGVAAIILFLLYSNKIKFIGASAVWGILLGFLPLLVISADQLIYLYKSWLNLLSNDHSASYGLSLMGILQSWFQLTPPKMIVLLGGAILLLIPFARYACFEQPRYRYLLLASLLIWMIIFNHKAESPTFIIAMSGIAIWYFTGKKSKIDLILLIGAFILTTLSHTDLFPRFLKHAFVSPYKLKALPAVIIWFKIQYELLTFKEVLNVGADATKAPGH